MGSCPPEVISMAASVHMHYEMPSVRSRPGRTWRRVWIWVHIRVSECADQDRNG